MANITIIGGGSSAHTAIPLLSMAGHSVRLLTHNPQKWDTNVKSKFVSEDGVVFDVFEGTLDKVSSSYDELIPDSEVVLLCLPVNQYPDVVAKVAKSAKDKKIYLGTVYGQGGFDWIVDYYKTKFNKEKIVPFTFGLIPWICRTEEYGKVGVTYGCKDQNTISIKSKSEFDYLNELFLDDICFKFFNKGHFSHCNNFISSTLSVDNQIIHMSRMYGLYLKANDGWNDEASVPLFYKDYDQLSADLLTDLDADYEKIRIVIRGSNSDLDFNYMLDYLELERFSYGSTSESVLDSFKDSTTLGTIKTPVKLYDGKFNLDKDHRFFYDDLYFGLVIAKWMAQENSILTPTIDKIILWAQEYLGTRVLDENGYLENDKLESTPTYWGINDFQSIIK